MFTYQNNLDPQAYFEMLKINLLLFFVSQGEKFVEEIRNGVVEFLDFYKSERLRFVQNKTIME